jgi:hypothetical protein
MEERDKHISELNAQLDRAREMLSDLEKKVR